MGWIHTVRGRLHPDDLGLTLPHEHIMVDFSGADITGPHRWDPDVVVDRMLPYLQDLVDVGAEAFVDATPAYLGRDVRVLRRLSEATGLHIVTNTGWYKPPSLPPRAETLTPEEIAAEWIAEFEQGIDGSDVRPGLIKIAVNPGPLDPLQLKIVEAAARTHLATGLTVASHTGEARAAQDSLDVAEAVGMDLSRYIIVHADQISSLDEIGGIVDRGAWVEYDAIGTRALDDHVDLLMRSLDRGWVDRILLSQDAGWYAVGEPNGGTVRPYTTLLTEFRHRLAQAGVDDQTWSKLTEANPAVALATAL
jgi:phosphotriesterase-related protein